MNRFIFFSFILLCVFSCDTQNSETKDENKKAEFIEPNSIVTKLDSIITDEIVVIDSIRNNTASVIYLCDIIDFLKLKNKKTRVSFFKQLDSTLGWQYPETGKEPDPEIFVDFTPEMLYQFLSDINEDSLRINERFEKVYHFNISPPDYSDTSKCKDKILVELNRPYCNFRIVIFNTFLVDDGWCTESQITYYIKIKGDKVVSFSRFPVG